MEYNIYLDVFFLRNFALNLLILRSAAWIFRKNCSWKRLLLAAFAGSGMNCLWLIGIVAGNCNDYFFLCVQVTTAFTMAFLAFQKKGKELIMLTVSLVFLAFCTEGAVSWWGSFTGAVLVPVISFLIGKERKKQEQEIKVTLNFKGRQKEMKGFYDSGNLLTEPLTGKMVHIACYDEVRELLPQEYRLAAEHYFQTGFLESTKVMKLQMYEFTFLSYHSIGKETGQLLGIRMDSAVFENHAGKKTEEKAVIGLADQKLFVRGQGRIIINGRLEL